MSEREPVSPDPPASAPRPTGAVSAPHERLDLALAAAPMGLWEWDLETGQVRWSGNLEAVRGREGGHGGTAEALFELVHPDDRAAVRAAQERAIANGSDYAVEYRYRRADGSLGWAASWGHVVGDEAGRPVRMLGIGTDVTARRQAEEALRESEQKLRLVFEQVPATIWTTDRELRFTSVTSIRGAEMENVPPARELVGRKLPDLREDRERLAVRVHLAALEGRSGTYVSEYAGRELDSRVEPLRDAAGEIVGVIGVAFDVTDARRAERELATSEARYRQLFDNANDIISITAIDGRLVEINRVAEQLTGWTREELLALPHGIVAPEYDEISFEQMRRKLAGEAETTVYEVEYLTRDGGRIPVEVSSTLVREGGVATGVQLIARDLRPRRRLEEQVLQSQRLESVGRLAGGVAHEFNNLLMVLLGHSELLLKRLESPLRDEAVAIQGAAERAASLTRQLLAYAGKQILRPQELDVNEVLAALEPLLRAALPDGGRLELRLGDGLPPVFADRAQLEQAVVTLALSGRDGGQRRAPVTVATSRVRLDAATSRGRGLELAPGDYVLLSLQDTARVLDDAARAHVFEPFFPPLVPGQGTGLELASVLGTIRQSGGDIVVASEPASGTTFEVYLPGC